MQTSRVKSASDVGDVRNSVEISEDSIPVDQKDVAGGVGGRNAREPETVRAGPGGNVVEVLVRYFVGRDDEPRIGNTRPDLDPCLEQRCLVSGPGRSGNESGHARTKGLHYRQRRCIRPLPDLVVASIAGDTDALRTHP